MRVLMSLILAGLTAATASATEIQVGAGDPAPVLTGKTWINHEKTSLDELRGKVVFLDVWRTWCGPCTAMIPHLNSMHRKYGDKGLVVLGITDEAKSMVNKHIEKHSMEFPIAIVDPGEERSYGVEGFPTSLLIDVDGTIVWRGHPAAFEQEFGEKRLEEMLQHTTTFPELPKAYAKVGTSLEKGDYGKAWVEIDKALAQKEVAELLPVKERLDAMANRHLEQATKLLAENAYGAANQTLTLVQQRFAGMPQAEDAAGRLAEIAGNKEAASDISAAERFADAMASWREGDFEKSLKALDSLAKRYPGTPTAERANEILDRHRG